MFGAFAFGMGLKPVSSVSVVANLLARLSGFDFRQRQEFFSVHHRFQMGSEVHPATYKMGTRGSLPGSTDHLSHVVPRFRMRGVIPPFPHSSSWRGILLSTGTTLHSPCSGAVCGK
jgi:hypothetical protein